MRSCPQCGGVWAYSLSDGRFKCRRCGHRYSRRSVWASSRLPESTKRRLVELFAFGVPVYRQRFREDGSSAAKERFYRLLRACCAYREGLREPFEGALECDESTFGGSRHGKRGWGAAGKVIVFGIIKRNGMVKASPIAAHDKVSVMGEIQAHTRPGSLYYTDDWQAYATLRMRGEHVVIRKEKGRPKGRDHINGIEGFWSYAKTWLAPFRGVPRKFFHLYLGEICFRFNHRHEDIEKQLIKLVKSVSIKQIDQTLVRIG